MQRLSRSRSISSARFAFVAAGLLIGTASARAEWPLVWDLDGRGDEPVAARRGPGGDLWVLTESYLQGQASARAILLRIAPDGGIVWATPDPELSGPVALALCDDGSALAIGSVGTQLRVTAFTAAGAIAWSRSRSGVAADEPLNGLYVAPIWDATAAGAGGPGAWRIPCGLAGGFAVLSFTAGTRCRDEVPADCKVARGLFAGWRSNHPRCQHVWATHLRRTEAAAVAKMRRCLRDPDLKRESLHFRRAFGHRGGWVATRFRRSTDPSREF